MSQVLTLVPKADANKEALVELIDVLRERVESGQVVAFAAIGIGPKDDLLALLAAGGVKTKVQMMGAIDALSKSYFQSVS